MTFWLFVMRKRYVLSWQRSKILWQDIFRTSESEAGGGRAVLVPRARAAHRKAQGGKARPPFPTGLPGCSVEGQRGMEAAGAGRAAQRDSQVAAGPEGGCSPAGPKGTALGLTSLGTAATRGCAGWKHPFVRTTHNRAWPWILPSCPRVSLSSRQGHLVLTTGHLPSLRSLAHCSPAPGLPPTHGPVQGLPSLRP